MSDLTILHNTACSTSRYAVQQAAAGGADAEVVQYLRHPLTRDQLLELIGKLEDPPADLVRKDPYFATLNLDPAGFTTPQAVADLLAEHPRLMQRPILIRGDRAIIGRPRERVTAFLTS